jgi:hypothetical protein
MPSVHAAFHDGNGRDDDDMSTSSSSGSVQTSKDDKGAAGSAEAVAESDWEKEESRFVLRSRKLVMLVFILATIACATATFFFVKKSEQATFRLQVCCASLLDVMNVQYCYAFSLLTSMCSRTV